MVPGVATADTSFLFPLCQSLSALLPCWVESAGCCRAFLKFHFSFNKNLFPNLWYLPAPCMPPNYHLLIPSAGSCFQAVPSAVIFNHIIIFWELVYFFSSVLV